MTRVVALLAAVLAATLALAACGGGDGAEPGAPEGATLVLDFQPNAVHAPLYAGRAEGDFSAAGIDLDIREPSSSADSAKLLEAGRADLAIMDINDFGIARARGLDLVAVAAIVQRPLASVIAVDSDQVTEPSDLEGETVGVTGVPSDDAVLRTILEAGGLEPDSVDTVTIGFTAVPALAGGRVGAATAFWNAEGVELRQQGVPTTEFRVDQFGAPRYPELVLVARGDGRRTDDPEIVCGVLEGLGHAYARLDNDPQATIETMLEELPTADPDSQRAQFAELIAAAAFSPQGRDAADPGLDPVGVLGWAKWAYGRGLLPPGTEDDVRTGFAVGEPRRCALGGG